MKKVFADSFYSFASLNSADQAHQAARQFVRRYQGEIVTTRWVLAEVCDGLSVPANRKVAADLMKFIQCASYFRIVENSDELFHRGFALFEARTDKEWSLTDCISFVVMREEGLTDALTGDRHFEQAGFRALLKP